MTTQSRSPSKEIQKRISKRGAITDADVQDYINQVGLANISDMSMNDVEQYLKNFIELGQRQKKLPSKKKIEPTDSIIVSDKRDDLAKVSLEDQNKSDGEGKQGFKSFTDMLVSGGVFSVKRMFPMLGRLIDTFEKKNRKNEQDLEVVNNSNKENAQQVSRSSTLLSKIAETQLKTNELLEKIIGAAANPPITTPAAAPGGGNPNVNIDADGRRRSASSASSPAATRQPQPQQTAQRTASPPPASRAAGPAAAAAVGAAVVAGGGYAAYRALSGNGGESEPQPPAAPAQAAARPSAVPQAVTAIPGRDTILPDLAPSASGIVPQSGAQRRQERQARFQQYREGNTLLSDQFRNERYVRREEFNADAQYLAETLNLDVNDIRGVVYLPNGDLSGAMLKSGERRTLPGRDSESFQRATAEQSRSRDPATQAQQPPAAAGSRISADEPSADTNSTRLTQRSPDATPVAGEQSDENRRIAESMVDISLQQRDFFNGQYTRVEEFREELIQRAMRLREEDSRLPGGGMESIRQARILEMIRREQNRQIDQGRTAEYRISKQPYDLPSQPQRVTSAETTSTSAGVDARILNIKAKEIVFKADSFEFDRPNSVPGVTTGAASPVASGSSNQGQAAPAASPAASGSSNQGQAAPAGSPDRIQNVVQKITQEFPAINVTSTTRPGSGTSQHATGNAADLSLRGLSQDQRASLVQNLTSGKYGNVGGLGTYNATGDLLHVDTRSGPKMAWGPNRSRTSLNETPQWFQQSVTAWMGGGGSQTQAAGAAPQEQEPRPGGEQTPPPAATPEPSTPSSGAAVAQASVRSETSMMQQQPPTTVPGTAEPAPSPSGSVEQTTTMIDPNEPGPVEPPDAAQRYAKLFNLAA